MIELQRTRVVSVATVAAAGSDLETTNRATSKLNDVLSTLLRGHHSPVLIGLQFAAGRHRVCPSHAVAAAAGVVMHGPHVPSLELKFGLLVDGDQMITTVCARQAAEVADAALFHQHLGNEGSPAMTTHSSHAQT